MKIEISGSTGDANRIVRVTVGGFSETMSHSDFSRLLAAPLPLAGEVVTLAKARGIGLAAEEREV